MKVEKTITIEWDPSEVPENSGDVREKLEEDGFERAMEMAAEGFTSGEFCSQVAVADEDHDVRGWWSLGTKVIS